MQRVAIKRMLQEWEREHPGRIETIFSSLRNVVPSHLADPVAFDFAGLSGSQVAGSPDDWIDQAPGDLV